MKRESQAWHGSRRPSAESECAGYVDIHAHLLPGIDDGPSDMEQALEMARAADSSGIATIAATPHLHPDFPGVHVEELGSRCDELGHAQP